MKRTVSVNIKGINFMIEEGGYESLQSYMKKLESILENQDGNNEIIEDVELRIAEICSAKISGSKTVIEAKDIDEILTQLGDPSSYIDEENEISQGKPYDSQPTEKRLFRDVDNGMIGGVCQGMSNYFNLDIIVMRGIFLFILLFAGFGIPLYLILWIVIPKAESSIDRLRMKGKPITVESVREEVELAGEKIKDGSKRMASRIEKEGKKRLSWLGKVLRFGFGGFLIIWGLIWLVTFLIFGLGNFQFFPIQNEDGLMSFQQLGDLVLINNDDVSMVRLGTFLLGFSTVTFAILAGIMLITKMKNNWSKFSLLGLFGIAISGAVVCGIIGVRTGKDFVFEDTLEIELGNVQTDTLYIQSRIKNQVSKSGHKIKGDNYDFLAVSKDSITLSEIDFKYIASKDSLFRVRWEPEARGRSKSKAIERAENIRYNTQLHNNQLILDSEFSFPKEDKLRDQRITFVIEIPENGKIIFNEKQLNFTDEHEDDDKFHHRGHLKKGGKYYHRK